MADAFSEKTMIEATGTSLEQAEPCTRESGFLDRHAWLPFLLLFLLPFVVHAPLWLLGRSTDPILFYSGAATTGGGSLGLNPYIDPNVGSTSEALGRLAAWDWAHHIVPWWNPYSGIGMPLAGELQPEAFFLPINLLLLLPNGVLWQQICIQIMAGLATYALLRELKISRLAATTGGGLFALSAVIAWTPGPAAVYCVLPFLPMLLWGIERARKPGQGPLSILIIGVAIAWSILAGFPEPAYLNGLLAFIWGAYRMASDRDIRWPLARRAITGWVLGVLISAPLLIAFADYIRQSDSFGVHNAGEQSLPWSAFPTLVMPYVFGSLHMNIQSPLMDQMWARIGGYSSILIILIAAVGLLAKSTPRGLKYLLLAWILLTWAKTFGMQPVMGLLNLLPLVSKSNFLRYAPQSWGMALVILASYGLDEFRQSTPRRRYPFLICACLLVLSVTLAWPLRSYWERPRALAPVMFAFLGISLVWIFFGWVVANLAWKRAHGTGRRVILASLLLVDAAVMFMVPTFGSVRPGKIDTSAVEFLRSHLGLSRFYSLGPIQPNYSAYFRTAGIDHNVLPVPKLWSDYIDRSLLPGNKAIDAGVTFWPGAAAAGAAESALSTLRANFLDLGVRYVITSHGKSPAPTSIAEAGTADGSKSDAGAAAKAKIASLLNWCRSASQNPGRPLTGFVARLILKFAHAPSSGTPGHEAKVPESNPGISNDGSLSLGKNQAATPQITAPTGSAISSSTDLHKVYEDDLMDIWEVPNPAPYFQVIGGGPCVLSNLQRESLAASCSSPATLVRRELYMAGWHATVNRNPGKITQDGLFEAITLPAGENEIRYDFVPPYVQFGWICTCIGVAGLGWQVIVIGMRRRQTSNRKGQFLQA